MSEISTTKKHLVSLLLGSALTWSLGGCDVASFLSSADNPPSKSSTEDSNKSSTESSTKAENIAIKPLTNTDTTLAKVTLKAVVESVKLPLMTSDTLSESTLNCVNKISEDFAVKEVQTFYNNHFSASELDELNSFYKTDEAIAYTNYGRDQLLIASGLTLKKPAKQLKKKELEKINAFIDTPLGQKYIKVTQTTEAGSLSSIVMPSLTEELKKCGINI